MKEINENKDNLLKPKPPARPPSNESDKFVQKAEQLLNTLNSKDAWMKTIELEITNINFELKSYNSNANQLYKDSIIRVQALERTVEKLCLRLGFAGESYNEFISNMSPKLKEISDSLMRGEDEQNAKDS